MAAVLLLLLLLLGVALSDATCPLAGVADTDADAAVVVIVGGAVIECTGECDAVADVM